MIKKILKWGIPLTMITLLIDFLLAYIIFWGMLIVIALIWAERNWD